MSNLMTTKIAGAGLATALGLFALAEASGFMVPQAGAHGGGHHGDEHSEKSLNEQYAEKYAYYVNVAEPGADGAHTAEPVFDFGAALASADISKGERAFKGNCKTCHTIEQGGADGTGPNLFAIVGRAKTSGGFSFSSALQGIGGNWSYEDLDAWLEKPGSFAKGTSMSFIGLRKDKQRAEVIAYLASVTPEAPAFPAALPAEAPEGDHEGDAEDAALSVEGEPAGAEVTLEGDGTAGVEAALEGAAQDAEATIESVTDSVTGGMEEPDQAAFDHAAGTDVKDKTVEEDGEH